MSDSATPGTAARQGSLSISNSGAYSNSGPSCKWCHPATSVVPFFSSLQSFPASGSFLMSELFSSGGQSIGASASVLPMSIQGWFPLGLTGLISLQSKGLRESSPTPQFKRVNFWIVDFRVGQIYIQVHFFVTSLCRILCKISYRYRAWYVEGDFFFLFQNQIKST